ncbi:response regulator [Streptomyces sp. NPDC101151]|uniref:response regulator n=1 Tax=Streptomyces sp. NPDC101151 TaxID=3366115 RepID=UPI00381748AB
MASDQNGADERAVRVVVADDQPFARFALRMLLDAHPRIHVVAVACNGQEAVQRCQEFHPDVVVMDVRMPEAGTGPITETAGITATRQIMRTQPTTKVLVHSEWDGDPLVVSAMRAGACGYLRKADRDEDRLALIILVVASGASVFTSDNERLRRLFSTAYTAHRESALPLLTPAEREVVNLVASPDEPSNQEIATVLGIAKKTVANRILQAREKLSASDRKELIAMARAAGLGT